jgi:hypothetical protein
VSDAGENTFALVPNDATQTRYYLKAADEAAAEFARQAWVKDIQEMKATLGECLGKLCFAGILCIHTYAGAKTI